MIAPPQGVRSLVDTAVAPAEDPAGAPAPAKRRKRRTPPAIDPVTRKFVKSSERAFAEQMADNPPYVDPLRVNFPPELAAQVAAVMATPDPVPEGSPAPQPAPEKAGAFKPIRVWTAGPNMPREKIYTPWSYAGIRPAGDGAYYLRTPREVQWFKQAVGTKKFWVDTVPEDEPDLKCDHCGWHCRSYQAMHVHSQHAHGRSQGS